MKDVMTLDEVALFLQVSLMSVRRYIDAGKLKKVQMGRVVRILRADLEAFITASYV